MSVFSEELPGEDRAPARTQDEPFYCPGCGRRYSYRRECVGRSSEQPHPPIEVVSTDELNGDPAHFTPAPNTGR